MHRRRRGGLEPGSGPGLELGLEPELEPEPERRQIWSPRRYGSELRDGLAFVRRDPLLPSLLVRSPCCCRRAPAPLRRRVLGAIGSAAVAGVPVTVLATGYLVDLVGVRTSLAAAAVSDAGVCLIPTPHRAWTEPTAPAPAI
jgi:hypothetical protein